MHKPTFPSSVITSTPLAEEATRPEDNESEVVYYTVRGKRRRKRGADKRDGDTDLFRKLCVWYGTIPAPEAMSELSQQASDLHEQELLAREETDELDWNEHAEDTMPLLPLPFAVEGEAVA